jgi:hypothetical protein
MDKGNLGRKRQKINAYSALVGKPERKKSLEMPWRQGQNIKLDLIETGSEVIYFIYLGQDRDM